MMREGDTTRAALLLKGQVARGFNLRPQQRPMVQTSMFTASATIEPRTEPACDHVGTDREEQLTLAGEIELICGACGAIVGDHVCDDDCRSNGCGRGVRS